MTKFRFTKKDLAKVPTPARGKVRVYDTEVPGFGMVVWAGGTRRFFLRRMVRGRAYTIDLGEFPATDVQAARDAALAARASLDTGPQSRPLQAAWDAFQETRLPGLADRTRHEYTRIWQAYLQAHARTPMPALDRAAMARLHAEATKDGTYIANKVRAVLSSILHHAVDVGLLDRAPAMPKRHKEAGRKRWLNRAEISRLLAVLYTGDDSEAWMTSLAQSKGEKHRPVTRVQKAYFLVLLFTGSRRSEVASMAWADLDLNAGLWMRTQKGGDLVPTVLAGKVVKILRDLGKTGPWVFPARSRSGHIEEPKDAWRTVCYRARIENARIHDLRHTHASWMAQAGVSLQIIGGQLGHRQTATTERYAHLTLDPVRAAVEAVVAEMVGGNGFHG